MQIATTARIKLLPTPEQETLIKETMDLYRRACNYASGYAFKHETFDWKCLHRRLSADLKQRFGIGSMMILGVINNVVSIYKKAPADPPLEKRLFFKNNSIELSWEFHYMLRGETASIQTVRGWTMMPFVKKGMEKYFDETTCKFSKARLIRKNAHYYLHISVKNTIPSNDCNGFNKVVGIDRGINFVMTTYDSDGKTTFYDGRQYKQKRAKYQKVRKELQKRGTRSAKRRLLSIGNRERSWMKHIDHVLSKRLVDAYPKQTLFVMEDLTGIQGPENKLPARNRYLLNSWSFLDLEEKIKYKARMKGSMVINVSPRYTSQRCPKCGFISKENRDRKTHSFECLNCGYRSNDDRIAAMNLYQQGKELNTLGTVPLGHRLGGRGADPRPTM